MSHTPNFDAKVEAILIDTGPRERACKLTGKTWLMTDEEIGWFRKFNVPPSVMHPHTRWQLAIGQYVGYQWWWHGHAETGKPLLSTTHPATGLKVLPDEEWHAKDFAEQGRDYDSQKSFFEQFRKLQLDVPMTATRNFAKIENSIAAVSHGAVNSYFTLASSDRDSVFTTNAKSERSCLVDWSENVQDSFMVADAKGIYNSKYVLDSAEVRDSHFVFYSKDVEKCFAASNQSHKKFIWFDEQLSEGEWNARMSQVDLSCRSTLKEFEAKFINWLNTKVVWPEAIRINAPGCTGEYLIDCLDLVHSYACADGVRDCFWVIHNYVKSENNAFLVGGAACSDNYYSVSNLESSLIKFCAYVQQCRDMEYSMNCVSCEYCFGCIGLKHKKFHIFNKPYPEADYWKRVDELKCAMLERGEYGEFFPMSFSPSYQPYGGPAMYLLSENSEYQTLGALDFDPDSCGALGESLTQAQNPTPSSEIPDCIDDDPDAWIGKALLDTKNGRRFTYLKPEVDLYKKQRLPLPDEHFIHRIMRLNSMLNGAIFLKSACGKCGKPIEIAKNKMFPDRIVYCLTCYSTYVESR
jgi:hypothetical protein